MSAIFFFLIIYLSIALVLDPLGSGTIRSFPQMLSASQRLWYVYGVCHIEWGHAGDLVLDHVFGLIGKWRKTYATVQNDKNPKIVLKVWTLPLWKGCKILCCFTGQFNNNPCSVSLVGLELKWPIFWTQNIVDYFTLKLSWICANYKFVLLNFLII